MVVDHGTGDVIWGAKDCAAVTLENLTDNHATQLTDIKRFGRGIWRAYQFKEALRATLLTTRSALMTQGGFSTVGSPRSNGPSCRSSSHPVPGPHPTQVQAA
ncbi:hypothetical protein BN381_210026 [Candidatus Microthrix parvicella RN1]|uniref:Uncharacterized protein n=1 Tax=Candidatus Neomicrothrix parvicella RN1 TaxID=1229780 RepID=R4Z257_9ACTN|nr:hypothetical protein BN381_210026 [Candidatus Microthrix parvicella RN1]